MFFKWKKFDKFYRFKSCEEEKSWKNVWMQAHFNYMGPFFAKSHIGSVQLLRCLWQASKKTVWLFNVDSPIRVTPCVLLYLGPLKDLRIPAIDKVLICGYGCEDNLLSLKTYFGHFQKPAHYPYFSHQIECASLCVNNIWSNFFPQFCIKCIRLFKFDRDWPSWVLSPLIEVGMEDLANNNSDNLNNVNKIEKC